jgi:hypothetical protein
MKSQHVIPIWKVEQLISVNFFVDKISEYHSSMIDIGAGPFLQTEW